MTFNLVPVSHAIGGVQPLTGTAFRVSKWTEVGADKRPRWRHVIGVQDKGGAPASGGLSGRPWQHQSQTGRKQNVSTFGSC